MHFWWLQDFWWLRNMHFSMGKCIFFMLFGWLQKMHISYFVDFVQKLRFSWNYAFLMVPRFLRNMHFSMGKCIFFAFRLAAENAYFIFRWFCPKTKVFMELCIFDGSKIFKNMHFSMGKCICFLLFGWLQKMHISYFVDFVQKLRFSWNYAFLMVPRFLRNMHFSMGKCIFFCFSAGCRK